MWDPKDMDGKSKIKKNDAYHESEIDYLIELSKCSKSAEVIQQQFSKCPVHSYDMSFIIFVSLYQKMHIKSIRLLK